MKNPPADHLAPAAGKAPAGDVACAPQGDGHRGSCAHDTHAPHTHEHHSHDACGHKHDHSHEAEHGHAASGVADAAAPVAGASSWRVEGMDCGSCALTIRTALERMPGLADIRISVTNETLAVVLDESRTTRQAVESQLGKLGYKATRIGEGSDSRITASDAPRPWWRQPKGAIAIVAGVLVVLAYVAGEIAPAYHGWLFAAASLIAVAPVARQAFLAAAAGAVFTIQMLLTVAVAGALWIGASEEAAVVVFLFCVGEVLEGVAASSARAGIKALAKLVPQTALLDEDGRITEIPASALRIGQHVLVRPGDRVPADGKVVEGTSSVDESPITGESMPRTKQPGADVFAGSINHDAALKLRVERSAKDNMIARIVTLVEDAQEAKAPTERFIDRFSRVYMPIIVGLAIIVAVAPPLAFGGNFDTWLYRGLALLLIGCPCALVISVPAAIASSLSAGARRGLLIKGGAVMENLAAVRAIVFDKTGTLTRGEPAVVDIRTYAGAEQDLLALAAAVERRSSHPLALAIVALAQARGAPSIGADNVAAIAGKGMTGEVDGTPVFVGAPIHAAERAAMAPAITAEIAGLEDEGKTVVVITRGRDVAGLVALRDQPRADAQAGIAALKAMGVSPVMFTGDNERTGVAIGRLLGLEARARMLPSDKAEAVRAMAASSVVAMVGDGINDAPALASAQVGIAMGSGTDVALETADAALLHDRVGDVAALIGLARATMANIRQNIAIALGLKLVFLVTTIVGLTGLWLAILADTGGTVLVTLNALRLLGYFRGEAKPQTRQTTAA